MHAASGTSCWLQAVRTERMQSQTGLIHSRVQVTPRSPAESQRQPLLCAGKTQSSWHCLWVASRAATTC